MCTRIHVALTSFARILPLLSEIRVHVFSNLFVYVFARAIAIITLKYTKITSAIDRAVCIRGGAVSLLTVHRRGVLLLQMLLLLP